MARKGIQVSQTINRRAVDSAHLRAGFESLIADSRDTLKRYTPAQIAKSKILTRRQSRLAFYVQCLQDFDYRVGNNVRKAKRKTYLLGVTCTCGYTVRITRKWLDVAAPTCPNPDCDNVGKPLTEYQGFANPNSPEEMMQAFKEEFEQERALEKEIGTQQDSLDDGRPL